MKRINSSILALLVLFTVQARAEEGPKVIEAPPRVMVLPFTPVGNVGTYNWIGTAVQQSMLSEVNRPGASVFSISAPTTDPNATIDPITIASQSGATLVAYGTYQTSNDDIRCTGQLVDVNTKKVVASLSATGPAHDLFKIEDALTGQLHQALPQPIEYSNTTAVTYVPPQPQPVQVSNPAVVDYGTMDIAPSGYTTYGSYGYAYPVTYGVPYPAYTGYGYGAPCVNFSSGFVFYGNFGDRGRFRGFGSHPFGVGPVIGRGFQPHIGFNGTVGGLRANGFGFGFHGGGFGGGGFGGGFHGGGFHR